MRKAKVYAALIAVLAAAILVGMLAQPVWAQVRAALVRDVDTPALAPFQASVDYNFTFINDQRLLTTVPAGKRLVIEYISFWSGGPTDDQLVFGALRNGQLGPITVVLEIHPPHPSALSSTHTIQDGSQPVKAYFEPGEQVWVSASHNTNGSRSLYLRAIGHYITP